MQIEDALLERGERINFALRGLFSRAGYRLFRMSKFEEYDLYAEHKDFLLSDQVITFTDTDGKLMALKPDVTLSLINSSRDLPEECQKLFYSENVYRVAPGSNAFKEITQTGLECFGRVENAEILEVLTLAAESLRLLGRRAVLSISQLSLIEALVGLEGLSSQKRAALYDAIVRKNLKEAARLLEEGENPEAGEMLLSLLSLEGSFVERLARLKELLAESSLFLPRDFLPVLEALAQSGLRDMLQLDFSLISDPAYYNGLVFQGFAEGIPQAVISGGQYDKLMRKLRRRSCAVGFAVYTDLLERTGEEEKPDDGFLNIALPKGRLGEKVYGLLEKAGFECPQVMDPGRKLILENPEKKLRYFWVKPSDVAIYVERGAADIGVVGKDILLEYGADVYELLDLGIGRCRMAVAAPEGYLDSGSGTLRVATKFAGIARRYYRSKGRNIDIIHLNGSIEIAPILGLSDVIVDIVETGTTLKENHLAVVEEILPISARLIANKAAARFKSGALDTVLKGLAREVEA